MNITRKPASLKRNLKRALISTLVFTALAATGLFMANATESTGLVIGDAPSSVERPVAENSPVAVLAEHADTCWKGSDKPKADLPGAAIVQWNDGTTIYTENFKLVDEAFNDALATAGYGDKESERMTVIALCV